MTPEIKAKLDVIAQAACSNVETLYFSYEAAEECIATGIEGDFVECGVYAGAQCAAMALACQEHGVVRKIHLFDCFGGIPKGGDNDPPCLEGQSKSPIENTRKFLSYWQVDPDLLVWHVGMFADTVPKADIEQIAILRLDGDNEQSYRDSLPLYEKLVHGGFLIIDDWNLMGCRAAVVDFFQVKNPEAFMSTFRPKRISGNDGPIYLRKL